MAEVQSAPAQAVAQPREIPARSPPLQIPANSSFAPASAASRVRNSLLFSDTFSPSPVNNNGSYDFDRVLKSGFVHKRTRKTKSWKSIYLVLRPTTLSIYKDDNETKLRHKILLSDLTAVAFLKDPKQKRQNVFGLFSPSRNYHLQAKSRADADEWVELIRREARIEEEEEEMFLASPTGNVTNNYAGLEEEMRRRLRDSRLQDDRLGSSSPEPSDPIGRARGGPEMGVLRRPSHFDYSGNEPASHSDVSDAEVHVHRPVGSSQVSIPEAGTIPARPTFGTRNGSQMSGFNGEQDPERVVWQGYLLYLKSKSGVRQWKDLWAVLRAKSFALYKDENEYSPVLVIPLSSIINVVEIDPVSKTKVNCLQIITEEKSHRFCAHNEEALDKSLGAFKSLLAKRKEGEMKHALR